MQRLLTAVILAARAEHIRRCIVQARLMVSVRGRVMRSVIVLSGFVKHMRGRRVRALLIGLRRALLRRFVVRKWRLRRRNDVRRVMCQSRSRSR